MGEQANVVRVIGVSALAYNKSKKSGQELMTYIYIKNKNREPALTECVLGYF